MTRLEKHHPVDRDEVVYTLTLNGGDLARARLTTYDRLLLADCDASIADRLLALELIVRRIEQAHTNPEVPAC
jgi:hypothetical protein